MTTINGRYLVAKYIPDLMRGEPRNIGVVLWSPAGVKARFIAENLDHPGGVDNSKIPEFVKSTSAYKQWIRFWQGEIGKPAIEPATGGVEVPRCSPDFVAALQAANKSSFFLADGGMVFEPVNASELPRLINILFATLVETGEPEEARNSLISERPAVQEQLQPA